MMKRLAALGLVGSLLACRVDGDASSQPSKPSPEAVSPVRGAAEASSALALASSARAPTAGAALDSLDALDTRTAVPLLPVMAKHQKESMRDHLVAVQEISAALAAKDFAGIEKASTRIGYSETMGRMCSHMGAGAPGFTEQAIHFHRTADTIGVAAKAKDEVAVQRALAKTLATCTACHAAFKQRIVDEATWTSLTTMPAPSHAH